MHTDSLPDRKTTSAVCLSAIQPNETNRRDITIRIYSRRGGKTTALTAALSVLGLAVAGQAGASCMGSTPNSVAPNQNPSAMYMTPAIYRPGATQGTSFIQVSDAADQSESIVGLWQFKFVGFGPDYGSQAWHSDGTELIFSAGQNPETGDV